MITSTGSDMLHVSIPPDRRLLPVPGIAVHRAAHVVGLRFPAGQIPVTWAEDTVLDLTQTAQDFDDVCGWITAAFSRGKVSEGTMLAHMRERTRLKWREDLIHLIAEAASGTHSVLEYRYDRYVERAHGLPRARRQVRYVKPGGSRGYRDRCYEQYGVVVELDGKAYHPRENRWRETDRDNAAAADHGSSSLHYGWRHVRYEACQTARQVGKVLQNNGWPGTPTRCGSQCLIAES